MRTATSPCEDALTPVVWEQCACLLCGGGKHTPLLEAADALGAGLRFLVVRCEQCGLCFTNPRPDIATIERFYPADYHCHREKEAASLWSQARFAKLRRLLPPTGPARLLDFGCGAGAMLGRLQALGWNVTGLDQADAAVTKLREAGLTAFAGTLPNPRWTEPCFEAITMWQSLEHVHQPLEVLRAARRLLTPGGRLLVTVPNFASWAARWFGPGWFGLDLPRHLTHFTPDTLNAMLRLAGFDHVQPRQERRSGWIRHSTNGTGLLASRLGSSIASWWGLLTRQADSLAAIASFSPESTSHALT